MSATAFHLVIVLLGRRLHSLFEDLLLEQVGFSGVLRVLVVMSFVRSVAMLCHESVVSMREAAGKWRVMCNFYHASSYCITGMQS